MHTHLCVKTSCRKYRQISESLRNININLTGWWLKKKKGPTLRHFSDLCTCFLCVPQQVQCCDSCLPGFPHPGLQFLPHSVLCQQTASGVSITAQKIPSKTLQLCGAMSYRILHTQQPPFQYSVENRTPAQLPMNFNAVLLLTAVCLNVFLYYILCACLLSHL